MLIAKHIPITRTLPYTLVRTNMKHNPMRNSTTQIEITLNVKEHIVFMLQQDTQTSIYLVKELWLCLWHSNTVSGVDNKVPQLPQTWSESLRNWKQPTVKIAPTNRPCWFYTYLLVQRVLASPMRLSTNDLNIVTRRTTPRTNNSSTVVHAAAVHWCDCLNRGVFISLKL